MLKVLIVDDEEIICRMLGKLIDWEARGMEIAGMAHNGLQALTLMEELRPDIVMTDVRMPGMDGLQLVEKGKELNLEIDYIIMSGYKHFEYAYTALNLGVVYYLLKPINQKELEETLDRILKSRQEKLDDEQEYRKLEEIARAGSERVRKHFLNEIIQTNGLSVGRENGGSLELEREFENECFLAFLTKIDQNMEDKEMDSLLDAIDYMIEKTMQEGAWEYINAYVKRGVVTIVNYHSEKRQQVRAAIEKILQESRRELDKFRGFYVVIGTGGEKHSLADVQLSIGEAVEAVKCRIKLGTDKIIAYEDLNFTAVDIDTILTANERRIFERETESLDQAAFNSHADRMIQTVQQVLDYSPAAVFAMMEAIKELACSSFRANGTSAELLESFEESVQLLYDCNHKEGLLRYRYEDAFRQLFRKIAEERQNKSQRPIRVAEQYIRAHYAEPVTLEEVAAATGLSAAYLSTIFKKEKGIGFSDYLTLVRMDEAKRLLKETDDPVSIVAEQAGYTDAKYFSRIFSKMVGLKPSEYRKLYS